MIDAIVYTSNALGLDFSLSTPIVSTGSHQVCLTRVNDLSEIPDHVEVLASQESGSQADQIAMWNNMGDELYAKVELAYDRTPQMIYNEDGTESGEYYTPQKAIGVIA